MTASLPYLATLLLLATAYGDRRDPCKRWAPRVGDMVVKYSVQPTSKQSVLRLNAAHLRGSRGISREITTLRGTGHHWSAWYNSCRYPINRGTGNPGEYDRHGKITVDNTNKSVTCISEPAGTAKRPKSR